MRLTNLSTIALRYIPPIVLACVFTGCFSVGRPIAATATPDPSLLDRSLLTDTPCPAPCWYRLEPGVSTTGEVTTVAQNLPFVDPTDFPQEPFYYRDPSTQGYVTGTLIRLKCRRSGDGTCASLLVVDDILKQIYLDPPPSLTFGEVVAHFGPPDFVRRYPVEVSPGACNLAMIWKKRAIWVAFLNGQPKKDQVRCADVAGGRGVDPELPVQQVVYSTVDDFAIAIAPQPGGDFPWPGFAKP